MTSSYCDFSDLPAAQCDHCKEKPEAVATTPARHDGTCPRCLGPITKLDIIGCVQGPRRGDPDEWLCPRCYR